MTDLILPVEKSPSMRMTQIIADNDQPLTVIARLIAGGASLEAVQQLKSLVEWDDQRRARAAFNTAFALAKPKFKQAKRSGDNKRLNARYSLLTDLDDATREALGEHGFAWRHTTHYLDGGILSVTCILSHKDGHSEEAEQRAKEQAGKTGGAGNNNSAVNELQAGGITETYLKRRTLAAVTGLVSDMGIETDTDGEDKVETINEEQGKALAAIITQDNVPLADFLKYLATSGKVRITKIEEIPANMFEHAKLILDDRRKRKAKNTPKDTGA